jgi:hypothetical protein
MQWLGDTASAEKNVEEGDVALAIGSTSGAKQQTANFLHR